MSSFDVKAYRLTIQKHPDPEVERIELAAIGGYVSVVPRGLYQDGDLAVYIPEQAIVPMEILQTMGLIKEKKDKQTGEMIEVGGLAGPEGTRVKAARFRGTLSQGLVYNPKDIELVEGEDYAEALGIVKWVPPIPSSLAGDVDPHPALRTYTDIENIKKFMEVFEEGEEVVATEKLHGSCSIASYIDGEFLVSSKGLAGKGLAIRRDETADGRTKNTYWRMMEKIEAARICAEIASERGASEVSIFGETFGSGIQDLTYGLVNGDLNIRLFDIRVDGNYIDYADFVAITERYGLPTVPVLYEGPYDYAKLSELSEGKSTIAEHVREGVVVRPVCERQNPETGRTILKFVGAGYLTRKGDVTEYE